MRGDLGARGYGHLCKLTSSDEETQGWGSPIWSPDGNKNVVAKLAVGRVVPSTVQRDEFRSVLNETRPREAALHCPNPSGRLEFLVLPTERTSCIFPTGLHGYGAITTPNERR